MKRQILLAIGAVLLAVVATATDDARDGLILQLLDDSHTLNADFPVPVQINLLGRQIETVSPILSDAAKQKARLWAEELFNLGAQVKEPARSYAQGSALNVLARLDPSHALELLPLAQFDSAVVPSTKTQLAARAFRALISSEGVSAFPLIEQEASQMGAEGEYPYAAVASAASEAVANEWRSNPQHAREVLASVFDSEFAQYQQSAASYANDIGFGDMLRSLAGSLSLEQIRSALRLFFQRLLASAARSKYYYQADLRSRDGDHFKTDNSADAALVWYASVIVRDPELLQQIEAARPEIKAALDCVEAHRCMGGSFGTRSMGAKQLPVDPDAEARESTLVLAHANPDLALARLAQLPDDDKRTDIALQVAVDVARTKPNEAAEIIAQNDSSSADDLTKLNVISAKASLASSHGHAEELHELLQSGFQLATRLISESKSMAGRTFLPGLAPMVQTGARQEIDSTIAFLEALPACRLKAELLIGAANALEMQKSRAAASPK